MTQEIKDCLCALNDCGILTTYVGSCSDFLTLKFLLNRKYQSQDRFVQSLLSLNPNILISEEELDVYEGNPGKPICGEDAWLVDIPVVSHLRSSGDVVKYHITWDKGDDDCDFLHMILPIVESARKHWLDAASDRLKPSTSASM